MDAQARAETPQVHAELFFEAESYRPGAPLRAAIRLSVATGWHIYWKNPGQSGLPTTVDWVAPPGWRAGPVEWPYPERKVLSGLIVHAYEGTVVLLGVVIPPADPSPGEEVELGARVGWGACRDVCVQQEVRLSATLRATDQPPRDGRWRAIAAEAAAYLPASLPDRHVRATRTPAGIVLRVSAPPGMTLPSGPLTFFPEDAPAAARVVQVKWSAESLLIVLPLPSPDSAAPNRVRGVLLAGAGRGADARRAALRVDASVPGTAPDEP